MWQVSVAGSGKTFGNMYSILLTIRCTTVPSLLLLSKVQILREVRNFGQIFQFLFSICQLQ